MIPLQDTAISTSGDYERYFEDGGERFHHIINPATGRSAGGIQSVTILAPQAIDSDALSTTVFVLGIKKGLVLVNKLTDVDAIIIDADGKLHYSDELLMPGGETSTHSHRSAGKMESWSVRRSRESRATRSRSYG